MQAIRICFAVVFLAMVQLVAAPVGAIKGYVKDASGAVIPNATLTLRNQLTDASLKTASDDTGFYQFLQVAPSTYGLIVEASGFSRTETKNIAVLVDQIVTVDLKLAVGQVTETVEVSGIATILDTERVSTGTAFNSNLVKNLPTANRRFNDIAILTPGVSFSAPGTQAGGFASAGSRSQSTNWQIDGVNALDPQVAGPTQSYRIADAVQELSVITTAPSVEFGRQSGAQVNVVTKSGGNQFHGSAFEFFRNDKLQAADFFTNKLNGKKNILRHNQYGGTVGGPIRRDNTFFFFSWEGYKENAPTPTTAVVPTQGQRDAVRDPIARSLLTYFPLPTNTSAAEGTINYVGNAPNVTKDNTYLGRIDQNFGASDRLTGRYMIFTGNTLSAGALPTTGASTNVPQSQNLSVDEVHTWTASFLTEVRLGFSRNKTNFKVQDAGFNPATIFPGVPGVVDTAKGPSIDTGIPRINFSSGGYASLGSATNLPQGRITNTYELYLNNTKTAPFGWARHTMKFGYYGRREEVARFLDGNSRGVIAFADFASFAGTCPTCNGQSLLQSSSIRTGDTLAHYYRYPHAFYLQDDIKVRPNLTVNIGLRYELPSVASEKRNKGTNFIDGIGPVLLNSNKLLTLDTTKLGYNSFGTATAPISISNAGSTAAYRDFGPLLGFAYTPDFARGLLGDKKTVIRGGFRIGFDEIFNNIPVNQSLNAPFVLTTTQRAGSTQPAAGYPFALAFDQNIRLVARTTQAPGSPAVGLVSFNGYDPHAPTSYTESWNFGIQREITRNSSIDVSYIGSAGHKLGVFVDANEPKVVIADSGFRGAQAPNSQFFPFPQWGALTGSYATFAGNSIYNGLVVSGKMRLRDLTMIGSYTWSHGLDNSSAFFGSTGDAGIPDSRTNLRGERSNSANDQRHRFVDSFVYDLPFGHGRSYLSNAHGIVNQVAGGWSIAAITNLSSGLPFTVFANSGVDFSGFNQFVDRPDVIGSGPLKIDRGNPDQFFDPAFFGKVSGNPICPGYATASSVRVNSGCAPAGRLGTSARNGYYGPGLIDFDMTASKKFPLRSERIFLEYRADFFNMLNHTNFGLVSGNFTMSSSQFGLLGRTSAFNGGNTGGPRVIQMTLRLQF